MEKYRATLKRGIIESAIFALVLIVLALIICLAEAGVINITPTTGDIHWHSLWRGFVVGASTGVLLLVIFGMVQSIRALKDEKALKKLYNKENDERCKAIMTAARSDSMRVFLMLGLVCGIIAGFYNITIGITIIACAVIQAVLGMLFKLYYSKKF